jgi:hypothetical protein
VLVVLSELCYAHTRMHARARVTPVAEKNIIGPVLVVLAKVWYGGMTWRSRAHQNGRLKRMVRGRFERAGRFFSEAPEGKRLKG